MKCPICGKEMIAGKIESNREVMWIEESKKPQRVSSRLWFKSKAYAERCEACEIVVIKEEH